MYLSRRRTRIGPLSDRGRTAPPFRGPGATQKKIRTLPEWEHPSLSKRKPLKLET